MNSNGEIRERIIGTDEANLTNIADGLYGVDRYIHLNDHGTGLAKFGHDGGTISHLWTHNLTAHRSGILQYLENEDVKMIPAGSKLSVRFKVSQGGDSTENIRVALIEFTGTPADAPAKDPVSSWAALPVLTTDHVFADTGKFQEESVAPSGGVFQDVILENILVGSGVTNLGLFIWTPNPIASASLDDFNWLIKDIQMNSGTKARPYSPPKFQDDFERCRRFTKIITGSNFTASIVASIGFGEIVNNNFARMLVTYSRMRAVPGVSLMDPIGNYSLSTSTGASPNVTSVAFGNLNTDSVILDVDPSGVFGGGDVPGSVILGGKVGGLPARLLLDAEIGV